MHRERSERTAAADAGGVPGGPGLARVRRAEAPVPRFAFPMTVAFLVWYLLYVLLSTYAHDFMSTEVFGNMNVGPDLRPAPVRVHVRDHAPVRPTRTRSTDPIADEMRDRLEGHEFAHREGTGRPRGPPVADVFAAEGSIGEPVVNITIFGVFVLITLVITFRASRNNKSAADYYAAGRNISGPRTAWPSPATTSPRRRSSASPAPSPSSATTASCTRSASWWRGWSRCCWSPS